MMGSVGEFHEALSGTPDTRTRTRVIASAFEHLQEPYPHLPDPVTRQRMFAQVGAMAALEQQL